MKKGKISIFFLVAIMVMTTFLFSKPIAFARNADDGTLAGFNTREELVQFLNENQVPVDKQQILIEKAENNEQWDCYTKQNEVPKDYFEFDPSNGSQTKYYRFEDGSFMKVQTEMIDSKVVSETNGTDMVQINTDSDFKDGGFTTNGAITGSGYTYYYDYYIDKYIGTMHAWFFAEFETINGGADHLIPSGFYGAGASGFGTISSMPTITIVRTTEDLNLNRPALAYSSWIINHSLLTKWGGINTSGTYFLYLSVGGDHYYVSDLN